MIRTLACLLVLTLLNGCASLSYYSQAVRGHLALLADSRPVDTVLADDSTDREVAGRLALSQQILDFAHDEMALPDNGSYRHYVDVKRPYVVWTVIAAGEFSVDAKVWCYLFAGCAGYRGYFAEQAARREAEALRQKGWDVTVSGAAAYSTLGWLDDPLLSTMLYREDSHLVETIVHELAHQRFYVKGQTCLNESFATAVAIEGVRRWFATKGDSEAFQAYLRDRDLDRAFDGLLLRTRDRLAALYARDIGPEEMRRGKQDIFAGLKHDYARFAEDNADHRYDRWMARDLNNAHMAHVAAYHQLEPEFTAMIAERGGDMARFYADLDRFGKNLPFAGDCSRANPE